MPPFLARSRPSRRITIHDQQVTIIPDSGSPESPGEDISTTDYARRCRLLMELTKDLRDMGAGTLIALPRIVVIGSQSAGKSSLVEAVSGINVPRDAGTCTRCPMECSMSSSATSWSCSISLRFDYDTEGRQQTSSTTGFGPRITNKGQVEIWLRRAQAAILSPHLPQENFLSQTAEELREARRTDLQILKFSRNVVCVDIEDPDTTNLSFIDLPGLIQNESQDVIDLVRDLVVSYIGSENTLVLIAIPVSDDMENQQAVRLAREADPDGERTIGVLTKPDTLPIGATNSRQRWKEILQGQAHQTRHGYYCVRLPDDDERARNATRSESQRLAATFFTTHAPWNEISDRGRFGIPNFVTDISKLLVRLIENSLPDLKRDVDRLLTECINDSGQLPAPLTLDPATEILNRIGTFRDDLKGAVNGQGTKTLARQSRDRYMKFKYQIRATAPDFRPFVDHEDYVKPSYLDTEHGDEILGPANGVKTLDLLAVRKVIAESIGWELPGHVPFEALKLLIMDFLELWEAPSILCFDDVTVILSQAVDGFVRKHFGRFKQLETYIRSLIQTEFDDCKQKAKQVLLKTLQLERFPLYTQNTHYLESKKQWWLVKYTDVNNNWANYRKEYFVSEGTPVHRTRHVSTPRVSVDVAPDTYKKELELMAEVRAYFQVSYKRIIDYIPLTIEHELSQALVEKLQNSLSQSLFTGPGAPTAERMRELVGEDPAIRMRRDSLGVRMNRLMEIKQKLDEFSIQE